MIVLPQVEILEDGYVFQSKHYVCIKELLEQIAWALTGYEQKYDIIVTEKDD